MKTGGKICSTPVSLVDIYPTLVDFCGLPVPKQGLDGFSIRPLLEDPVKGIWGGPDCALSAWMGPATTEQRTTPYIQAHAKGQNFAIISDRYRYIRAYTGEEELYDHQSDPNEWINRVANPEYKTILKEMQNRLDKQFSENRKQ